MTDVYQHDEYRSRSKGRVYYDISYEYTAGNGYTYSGKIDGSSFAKAVGENFEVKYDPENPQN